MSEEPGPRLFTLPNGMRIVIQEDHSAPVVSLQAWVKVGSADETEEIAGVSHLIEHMLFKGTKKRKVGEIAREVESSGGYINAFTTYDTTVYYITMASRFFETGLDILSDALMNSSFDPEELEKEKEVVVEEIKRGLDIPETRAMNALFNEAYSVHPYRRPIIGYAQTVKALSRENVLDFFHKWYAPDNITFVVAGDIDALKVLERIKEVFNPFKSRKPNRKERPVEPEQTELRIRILREDVSETKLYFAFHVPEIHHRDTFSLDLLSSILGEGESSRLYRKVKREKELVNSIYCYTYIPQNPGVFIIGVSLEDKSLHEAIKTIWGEILSVRKELTEAHELHRAKIKLESDFIYQRETIQGQARQLGYFETIVGDINYEKSYLSGIKAVSPEQVREVANKYLTEKNLSVVILQPKNSNFSESDLKNSLKPLESAAQPHTTEYKEDIIKLKLDNGVTLILKENPASDIIALQAVLLGGTRFEQKKRAGLSNVLSRAWTKGTTRMGADEIARRIEEIGGNISGFSGRNTFGLSTEFLGRFLEEGVGIFMDVLLHPEFQEDELKKIKREVLEEIKNQEDNISKTAFNLFFKALYGEHPYGRDILGEQETVEKITRDDILTYYKKFVTPQNLVVVGVGNFKREQMIGLLKEKLDLIQPKSLKQPKVKNVKKLDRINKLVKTGKGKNQAHIILGFLSTTFNDEDRYPLQVLEAILSGQGGRLFLNLRDRESLAYDVRAIETSGIERGYFALYIASSLEKEERAIDGLIHEVKNVLETGVTEEEVERAKKYIIGNYEIGLQSSSAQASDIAFNEIYNLGHDFYRKYPEKINSVTAEDILRVARKYLDMQSYAIATVKSD